MTSDIFALLLVFLPPNAEPIAVPLGRDYSLEVCLEARTEYLERDPHTPGVVVCIDQDEVVLPPINAHAIM